MGDINLFRNEGSVYLKKVVMKSEILKSDCCDGYLIDASEKEARRIIERVRSILGVGVSGCRGVGKLIGIAGGDDAFNRRIVETLKVDYLVSCEGGIKKDSLKQRDSGINHVVAKIAKEKGILIVVDFNSIRKLEGEELALRLGRIIQNVKVCRKVGCGIRIGSFGFDENEVVDEKSRKAFGFSLGMSSNQVAESVEF